MKTGVCKEKGLVKCRCNELESKVGRTKREKEALETIIMALKLEKVGIEDELRNLKREMGN